MSDLCIFVNDVLCLPLSLLPPTHTPAIHPPFRPSIRMLSVCRTGYLLTRDSASASRRLRLQLYTTTSQFGSRVLEADSLSQRRTSSHGYWTFILIWLWHHLFAASLHSQSGTKMPFKKTLGRVLLVFLYFFTYQKTSEGMNAVPESRNALFRTHIIFCEDWLGVFEILECPLSHYLFLLGGGIWNILMPLSDVYWRSNLVSFAVYSCLTDASPSFSTHESRGCSRDSKPIFRSHPILSLTDGIPVIVQMT